MQNELLGYKGDKNPLAPLIYSLAVLLRSPGRCLLRACDELEHLETEATSIRRPLTTVAMLFHVVILRRRKFGCVAMKLTLVMVPIPLSDAATA